MSEDKQKLQLELQEISNQIYELKGQIDKEPNPLYAARMEKLLKELRYQALWYMDVISRS